MNVAFIGTGFIASRHLANLIEIKEINVVGHTDVLLQNAKSAADKWGGRAYETLTEMLATETVDVAWVCVPPFAHGAIEKTLVDNKIPFYVEKPIGVDDTIPKQVGDYIRHNKVLVNVGYHWRCISLIPELKSLLEETPPRMVRIFYHGPTLPPMWWRKATTGGGQVIEQVTHLVDLTRHLIGEAEVLSAVAERHDRQQWPGLDVATSTVAILRHKNGVMTSLTATCILDTLVDSGIEFYCDGRKISLVSVDGTTKSLLVEDADGTTQQVAEDDPQAIARADKAFIAAVQQNAATARPCSYEDALKTQQLCVRINQIAISNMANKEGKI